MTEGRQHQEPIVKATCHLLELLTHQEVAVGNRLSRLNPPPPIVPQTWMQPWHPAPTKPPSPLAPWVLTAGDISPYDDFKPKILKEVDDFSGDSNNISHFFLKCELHFNLFNRHFQYHPHKVIFCVS